MTRPEDFLVGADWGYSLCLSCPDCYNDIDAESVDTLGEMLELAIRHLAEKHPRIIDASIDGIEE